MPQTKLVTARLTRRFYDAGKVLHPVGTILTLPENEMPKSARVLDKAALTAIKADEKAAKRAEKAAKEPSFLKELTDAEAPETDATDVKPDTALSELAKKESK